jgi:hypothetical protein
MPKLALLSVLTLAAAGVLAGGCRPAPGVPAGPAAGSTAPQDGPLASSLQVGAAGDSVHLVLQVTNAGTAAVPLTFNSGQSAEFTVTDSGGHELWRFSGEMMFTQAIREESIAAGATRRFEATWRPPAGTHGQLTARAWLTARQVRAERSTYFTIP